MKGWRVTPLPDICCVPQQLGSAFIVSLVYGSENTKEQTFRILFYVYTKKCLNKIPTNISNTSFDILPMNSITNIGDLLTHCT